MATEPDTTDRTLGYPEGRITEQTAVLQDVRQDLAGLRQEVNTGFQEVRQEMRDGLQEVNRRIDRMFLATSWAIGGGIIAALVVLIVRGG